MNIFIVDSPFQLMCATEASNYFKSENNYLIIRETGEIRNQEQIDKILQYFPWDNIITVKYDKYTQFFKFLILVVKFKFYRVDKLFIGEFRSDIMWIFINNLQLDSVFLLDDGSHTIDVQNNSFMNLDKINNNINKLKKNIVKLFLLKNIDRKVLDLFTIYDFEKKYYGQRIIKNEFSFLQTRMLHQKRVEKDNIVYFIGSNMVENGMLDKEYFFSIMKKIKNYYTTKNLKLMYIPHRREDHIKLKNLDIELEYFNLPIELEFLVTGKKPVHIASFASTALYTLKALYDIKNIDSFLINYDYLKKEYHEKFISIYEYHKNYMNIIDLS